MSEPRRRAPWSLTASGPLYPLAYPRRDAREAAVQLAALRALPELAGLPPRARVLDVGCGPGRHLRAAAAAGLRPLGLDRSPAALARARRAAAGSVARGVAGRLPLASGAFDLALSLFSAFAHDGHGAAAPELAELARVLAPGGRLVLDLPLAAAVRASLVPVSRAPVGGLELRARRRLGPGGRSVHKRVELRRGRHRVARWFEHLPLFEPEDLARALGGAGLEVLRLGPAGDLAGFGPDRLLAIAGRPTATRRPSPRRRGAATSLH